MSRDHSLQPFDGGDIEMIRGLVEEQEVRPADQWREPAGLDVSVRPTTRRRRLRVRCLPPRGRVSPASHDSQPSASVSPTLLEARRPRCRPRGRPGKREAPGGERRPLSPDRPLQVPGVRFAATGEYREEGGLSGAVASRQADPVAGRRFRARRSRTEPRRRHRRRSPLVLIKLMRSDDSSTLEVLGPMHVSRPRRRGIRFR